MSAVSDLEPSAWWRAGLRFSCTGCGACCTGPGGTVRVGPDERAGMARLLGLQLHELDALHVRALADGTRILRERPNGDCVFLAREPDAAGRRGCLVYAERPRQCRTWPFWRGVLAGPAHWSQAGERCPGIGRGPLHGPGAIRTALRDDGTSGYVPPAG